MTGLHLALELVFFGATSEAELKVVKSAKSLTSQ
jgi:hypothetical protein